MSDSNPSVLITGANGFVGSRLCRKLASESFHVIAGVRKSADLSLLQGVEVEYRYGDITRPETLPAMVSGVDYVVHNAGVVKAKDPRTFFSVNETGTKSLFEAIAERNPAVKKAIYISSLAAAGPSRGSGPVTEDDQPQPISTYGRSKLKGERAALSFSSGFNVLALRPSGIYGPGDKEMFSFFDTVNKHIRPFIGNGRRKIQLVHVDDLCRAIHLALTNETESGMVCFVAERRVYAMKELVRILSRASGRSGLPVYIPSVLFKMIAFGSETVFRLVGATPMLTVEKAEELLASWEVSTERAESAFGFVSQIPFEQGARETFQWYRENGWLR